jgi:DNA repair exonuclease SbcCD ATPase subunit
VGASKRREAAQKQAVELLQKRAGALSSAVLARFAAEAAANPFEKVIEMIKTLLARLKEEAAAEAEHKAWCDEQLHDNKLKRNRQTEAVNKLIAEIEEKTSEIETLGAEIDTLVQEQADLAKAMEEATAFRETEHAENTATIADAVAGQEAVKKALGILHEFYSSQESLLQMQRQVPEMAAYKGMQNAKGGPIGMLEVILTDFQRLQAETEAAEATAKREYDEFMVDSTVSKKEKHKMEVKDRLEKDQTEFEKSELKKDLAAEEAELDAANKYYDTLKPLCLEIHVSYEERVAKRKEELAALNEAYDILDQKGAA